jgi:hypothetical protein
MFDFFLQTSLPKNACFSSGSLKISIVCSNPRSSGVYASAGLPGADNSPGCATQDIEEACREGFWQHKVKGRAAGRKPETAEPVRGSKTPFAESGFSIENPARCRRIDLGF